MDKNINILIIKYVLILFIALIFCFNLFPTLDIKINIGQYTNLNLLINNSKSTQEIATTDINNDDTANIKDNTSNSTTQNKITSEGVKFNQNLNVADFNVKATEPYIPDRISIPSALIYAKVVPVKIIDNTLEAPLNFATAGWSESSGKIGSKGTVIIDGHYDNKQGAAVFFNLKYLKNDEKVIVYSKDNKFYTYKVVANENYDKLHAPMDRIYKNDGRQRLNLITCYGTFDKTTGSYDRKLVVYTVLEGSITPT